MHIYGNRFFWAVFGNRHYWTFPFLCSVTVEHRSFSPCILIAGQVMPLSNLPRIPLSVPPESPSKTHVGFLFLFGVSFICFPQASSASHFAVGFRGKRAFQIFPVALPHVLCALLAQASPGPVVVVKLPQGCQAEGCVALKPGILCLLGYMPWLY